MSILYDRIFYLAIVIIATLSAATIVIKFPRVKLKTDLGVEEEKEYARKRKVYYYFILITFSILAFMWFVQFLVDFFSGNPSELPRMLPW
jgi:hypothetical protein